MPRLKTQPVEPHPLLQRPAGGLDSTALDLVDQAVGIDDLSDVDRALDEMLFSGGTLNVKLLGGNRRIGFELPEGGE